MRLSKKEKELAEHIRKPVLIKTNTSGYRGVWWDKSRNKWQAGLRVNGKWVGLVRRKTIEEAALAYKNMVDTYFVGEGRDGK